MAHHRDARRIGGGEGRDGSYAQSNDQSQSHCRLQANSEWRIANRKSAGRRACPIRYAQSLFALRYMHATACFGLLQS
jgi:hypothetical protein